MNSKFRPRGRLQRTLGLGIALAVASLVAACDGGGADDPTGSETGQSEGEGAVDPGTIGQFQYVNGTPAPGAECHIDANGGYTVGEYMADAELLGCDGEPVMLSDEFCGAAVGWTYYFLGAG